MAAPGRTEETCGPGAGTVCVHLPASEEACIVKQLLTMQASSISIVYCSPCELSSV